MPSAQIIVRQANGQTLVLSSEDRVVKEITIQCESPRCAARHNKKIPVEFTFDDQGAFPEAGDSFLSLILPERSPSNPGAPRCFCSAQCLKDYLTYQFLAPGPRQPEVITGNPETLPPPVAYTTVANDGLVRKTDLDDLLRLNDMPPGAILQQECSPSPEGDYIQPKIESFSHPVFTEASGIAGSPVSISQADGEGENPSGPRFL